MNGKRWGPRVTVAALVEQAGRFLMVEEETRLGLRFNQPAGHLEEGETLVQAVSREVKEETGYDFVPDGLVGIYLAGPIGPKGDTYLRFTFYGQVTAEDPVLFLDEGIIAVHWLDETEIRGLTQALRSPAVLHSLADWRAGQRFDLSILQHLI